jgi:hypothetical protein
MDAPSLAGDAVEALFRRTLRMAISLEGVSWTLAALRPPAQDFLTNAGLHLDPESSLPLTEVADRLQVPVPHAVAYVRTAGLYLDASLP